MKNRIQELDYLKCIFIILMIIFHLVYISDMYPYMKNVVYTFHMSAFLVISGYLVNVQKRAKPFMRDMLWILIPYAVMEAGYVVMSSILPVRDSVESLSMWVLIEKTFIHPMGPYWYLHTLVLCSVVYYLIYNYIKTTDVSKFIVLGLCFYVMSDILGVIALSSAIYFMAGVVIHQSRLGFISIFKPSVLAIVPLVMLCYFPANLDRSTLAGVVITYLAINTALFFYRYIPPKIQRTSRFVGRNTLVILLFSPIFTISSKQVVPFFIFDPSGICFILVSVTFTLSGCLSMAWIADRLNLSRFCFGKKRILQ